MFICNPNVQRQISAHGRMHQQEGDTIIYETPQETFYWALDSILRRRRIRRRVQAPSLPYYIVQRKFRGF